MEKEKIKILKERIANRDSEIEAYKRYGKIFNGDTSQSFDGYVYGNHNAGYWNQAIVKDMEGNIYFIDKQFQNSNLHSGIGYGRPVWGDLIVEQISEDQIEEYKKRVSNKNYRASSYEELMEDSELDIYSANTDSLKKDEDRDTDFYKKAQRIYCAYTANSRVALYEYNGKKYISERKYIVSNDGYCFMHFGSYSARDEIFEEVTDEEISEIFGSKEIAQIKYGENEDLSLYPDVSLYEIDNPVLNKETPLENIEVLSQKKCGSDDIAKLGKKKKMKNTEVQDSFLAKTLKKIKEIGNRE